MNNEQWIQRNKQRLKERKWLEIEGNEASDDKENYNDWGNQIESQE